MSLPADSSTALTTPAQMHNLIGIWTKVGLGVYSLQEHITRGFSATQILKVGVTPTLLPSNTNLVAGRMNLMAHSPWSCRKSKRLPSSCSNSKFQLVHSCSSDSMGAFNRHLHASSAADALPLDATVPLLYAELRDAAKAAADSTAWGADSAWAWAVAIRWAMLPWPRASTEDNLQQTPLEQQGICTPLHDCVTLYVANVQVGE